MRFGTPSSNRNPLAYADERLSNVPCVEGNREPTVNDTKYPLWTEWRITASPSSGTEGDFWKLVNFVAGQAIWVKIGSGGAGPTVTLSDTAGTKVSTDGTGNIQLEGTSGQIDILSDPINHKLVFSLPGGGGAVDSFTVQSITAPGVNPVVPTAAGIVTVSGAAVANHDVPIETHSRAINAYNIEVQQGKAVTPTPADRVAIGMNSYNTNQFDVDGTSGMVSLKGSTTQKGILTLTGDTGGAIGANASGNVDIKGDATQQAISFAGASNAQRAKLVKPNIDGQLPIGHTANGEPSFATLTAADLIAITNGAGSITLGVNNYVAPSANNWTPVIQGSTAAGVGTYTRQHGVYMRIGPLLIVTFDLIWSAHTGTGNMQVGGIPIKFGFASSEYIGTIFSENLTLPASTVQLIINGVNNQNYAELMGLIDGGARSLVAMDTAAGLSGTLIYFSNLLS